MDMEEIRYLLGGTIFARAKAYTDRIQDLNCEVAGNGVRHLSADVRGGGRSLYQTQVWLRENGSFVSASCSCPYNENGEGPCCKHIGALLMRDSESQGLSGRAPQRPSESPESIPGVVRGTANLQTPQPEEPPRRDSYASSLEMLFGKKWRGEEPESDYEARRLLQAYQEGALAEVDGVTGHAELRPHAAELEPELTLLPGELPWLRLRISADGGRQYVVKSTCCGPWRSTVSSVMARRWNSSTAGRPLPRRHSSCSACCGGSSAQRKGPRRLCAAMAMHPAAGLPGASR